VILVDTNVLLDVFQDDAKWSDWSQDRLDSASATDTLAINPVIYSELSIGFARIEELEAVIKEASLAIEEIPREALFLAGKAFLRYRRGRGTKRGVLPDLYRRARRCHALALADARRGSLPHLFPDRVPDRAMITMLPLARCRLIARAWSLFAAVAFVSSSATSYALAEGPTLSEMYHKSWTARDGAPQGITALAQRPTACCGLGP
jgi:predicted nucleic acid-binding protein